MRMTKRSLQLIAAMFLTLVITTQAAYACSVTLSGPSYAYDEMVYVTANVSPPGDYVYTWYVRSCENNGNGCTDWLGYGSNLGPTIMRYISPQTMWAQFKVDIRHTDGGPVDATANIVIHGAGDPGDCRVSMC